MGFMPPRFFRESVLMAVFFLAILSVSFYDVVFQGKTFKADTANSQALSYGVYGQKDNRPAFIPVNGTDASVLEAPTFQFIKESLKKGTLPLWNPHQAGGFPLIAMLEVGIFFPLNFLLYLLPNLYGWDVLIFARFWLGGLLTYFFMRTLKFKKAPALVSGLAFMLSGPMVLLQYWTANVDILTPLLLLTMERLIQRQTLGRLCGMALAFGLTIFAGHPEHIFFVNTFGAVYFLFRMLTVRRSFHKKTAGYAAAAYGFGFGLAAVVFFPFFRNLLSEFWVTHPAGVGLTTGEMKDRIITLALPYFFQKETLTYDFTFSGWWGGYIGILPFALGFFSLWGNQKRWLNYFFAGAAFLTIGKMYAWPFINWIGYLPVFNVCRFYIHTSHLFAFMVAVSAGMGARYVLAHREVFKKGLAFSTVFFFVILCHLFYLKSAKHFSYSLQATLLAAGILAVFQVFLFWRNQNTFHTKFLAVLLTGLVAGELFVYIHRERPKRFDSFPPVPYIETLKSLPEYTRSYGVFWSFYPNTATGYEMDDLGIYFSLLSKRFVNFVNNLVIPDFFKGGLRPPALRVLPVMNAKEFLDLLNVHYVIGPAQLLPNTKIFRDTLAKDDALNQLVYSREVNIYKRPGAFPRVFIVHKAVFETNERMIFEHLREIKEHLRDTAVITGQPTEEMHQRLENLPVKDNSTAHIVRYTPNEVVIQADMEYPGFVILSDAYHPDWKVSVNGKPAVIYPADYFLRSVFLTSGAYTVTYRFEPPSFYWGAGISAASFLLLVILFFLGRRKKNRQAL